MRFSRFFGMVAVLITSACGSNRADSSPEPKRSSSTIDVFVESHNYYDAKLFVVYGSRAGEGRKIGTEKYVRGNSTDHISISRSLLTVSGARLAVRLMASNEVWELEQLNGIENINGIRVVIQPVLNQSFNIPEY